MGKARQQAGRRWIVSGRVQGVGYRYFIQRAASDLGLSGYARNLEDGRVEVYAAGTPEKLAELSAPVRQGPWLADVRTVDEREAPVERYHGFRVE